MATPVVRNGAESVISFRPIGHAVLSYRSEDGRLKVGGVAKALRGDLAAIFARTILGRDGFFDGDGSQNLYILEPAEDVGPGFRIEHAHDPRIRSVRIVEVDVQRATDPCLGRDAAATAAAA